MVKDFLVTTVICFSDGSKEGRVLYVGDEPSCEKLLDEPALKAITYAGEKTPARALVVLMPQPEEGPMQPGQYWKIDS
jgi:hypothetical protein